MKILYYDCFSGISGDMNLGAMIDLGVGEQFLVSELNKLDLKGWKLEAVKDQRHGIKGTRVTVTQTRHERHHRHLSDIEKIINSSALDRGTKELSLKIFMKLAEAEAKVHDIPVEQVHFHEVGAVDSIIDIVGAAVCFNSLVVDAVHVSALELGGGMVRCEHGNLPVPAPATAEIVKDIEVTRGRVDFEATTPTGASIVAVLGNVFNRPAPMKIIKTAYGVGQKDHPGVPNLLRVFLCESDESEQTGHESLLLECNIDDMNPEFYGYISEKLFKSGVSDVFLTNIMMKKGRPGIILSVICEKEIAGKVKEIIFTESTSIGIRTYPFIKDTLVRKTETVNTSFGPVTYKRSYYNGVEVSCKPESDDCRRIAAETGRPVKEIFQNLLSQANNNNKKDDA